MFISLPEQLWEVWRRTGVDVSNVEVESEGQRNQQDFPQATRNEGQLYGLHWVLQFIVFSHHLSYFSQKSLKNSPQQPTSPFLE